MDKEKYLQIKEDIKTRFNNQSVYSFEEFIIRNSHEIIECSELFDEEFYFNQYPDVKDGNFDPIEHYLKMGVMEGCNPSSEFDTLQYLNFYPDVRNSKLNPFVHYILYGIQEDRKARNSKLIDLEEKYFVSVVMPTYNRREIISDAIDSVLEQSFKRFELLIIDDGSSDDTDLFIESKYKKYLENGQIRYLTGNHQGVSAARNIGLDASEGNIIAYLDSDNQWDLRYLEIMLSALDENDSFNCLYCDVMIHNRVTKREYVLGRHYDRKDLLDENFIDLNCFMHDRVLYDEKGGFDESLTRLVDWDLIIRYTEDNEPFYLKKVLVNYIIDTAFNHITLTQPLDDNMDRIREKYWYETYKDDYEAIKDAFDQAYYLENYGDVLKKGINPIYHYLEYGYKEGKNPNSEFVSSYYSNLYSDIKKNDLNPFVHYVKWGQMEGREINYFAKRDQILNNNLLYLSNYTFDEEPLVSIIILNRDGIDHLRLLFKDFDEKTNYSNYEIIVVDNASEDDSVEYLKSLDLPITVIENEENVSFSQGNNDAAKIANGEYILLLNNDIEPTYGWLNEMMGTIVFDDNVGAVGAKLLYPYIDDVEGQKYSFTIQHVGDIFREANIEDGCLYQPNNQNKYSEDIFDSEISVNKKCSLVTAAVYLTRKDLYLELGGLDEQYWYGFEDVDYNLKLHKAGYDIILATAALLFHHESATRKKTRGLSNHKVLCTKWSKYLFKRLLKDKIEKDLFFTDKKLNFLYLIDKKDFDNNSSLNKSIHNMSTYFLDKDYEFNIQFDKSNFEIDGGIDVILSFDESYNIEYINARKNIIKILLFNEFSNNKIKNYSNWDIIIVNRDSIQNSSFKHELEEKNPDVNVFYYDFDNLGENIINCLYDSYIDLKEDD